jgi:hypothetical protein
MKLFKLIINKNSFVTLFKVLASAVEFDNDATKFVRSTKNNSAQLFNLVMFAASLTQIYLPLDFGKDSKKDEIFYGHVKNNHYCVELNVTSNIFVLFLVNTDQGVTQFIAVQFRIKIYNFH